MFNSSYKQTHALAFLSKASQVKIVSFDVFDTVLTRLVGSPESNFLLFGKYLQSLDLLPCSAESFALIRAMAEQRAFKNAGGFDSDVSLSTIYREVGFILNLEASQWKLLNDYEIKHERLMLCLVPSAMKLVQSARHHGCSIRYTSDMYIGTQFIQDELARFQLWQPDDECYVSCDYQQSKGSGALFRTVLKRNNITGQNIIHCGNNHWSDVEKARCEGLKTHLFDEGNLNRYEEILESYTWATDGFSSVLAGTSRLTRLSVDAVSPHEIALRDVVAGVAAPLVIGLVLHVLQRSKRLGLKRIYFVSRDGQILVEIASRLIAKLKLDCEARYLYGSRQAWLLPAVTQVDEVHIAGIFTGKLALDLDVITVRIALARFCIVPDEIQDSLATIGLTPKDWDRNLVVNERYALNQMVLEDTTVQRVILEKASESRRVMLKYLEQEGLLDSVPYGFVDLGTGATLHYALSEVLSTVGRTAPTSFYLGLRGGVIEGVHSRPEPYFFDKVYNLGFLDSPDLVTIFEAICSADHGSVVTYEDLGDRVKPVLEDRVNTSVMQWGFPFVRSTLLWFTENLFLDQRFVNPYTDIREVSVNCFQTFWTSPTVQEATAWGSFPMEDGWGKVSFYHHLAHPYTLRSLPSVFWTGSFPSRRHWWHKAALVTTPKWLQFLLKGGSKVGRLLLGLRMKVNLKHRIRQVYGYLNIS